MSAKRLLTVLISAIAVFSMATTAFAAESGHTEADFGQGGRGEGLNITQKIDVLLEQGVIDKTLYELIQSNMNAMIGLNRVSIYDELFENGIITESQYEAILVYMTEKTGQPEVGRLNSVESETGEPPAMPDGGRVAGEPPAMPDGIITNSERSTMPNGEMVAVEPPAKPEGTEATDGTVGRPAISDGMEMPGKTWQMHSDMNLELYENGIIDEATYTEIQAYWESSQKNVTESEDVRLGVEKDIFALLLEKDIITQSQYAEIIETLSNI